MTDPFDVAVRTLKEAHPDQILLQLQKLFGSIRKFDMDTAISTLQALEALDATLGFNFEGRIFTERVKSAVRNRLTQLLLEYRRYPSSQRDNITYIEAILEGRIEL